jgi:hypothetical protein
VRGSNFVLIFVPDRSTPKQRLPFHSSSRPHLPKWRKTRTAQTLHRNRETFIGSAFGSLRHRQPLLTQGTDSLGRLACTLTTWPACKVAEVTKRHRQVPLQHPARSLNRTQSVWRRRGGGHFARRESCDESHEVCDIRATND